MTKIKVGDWVTYEGWDRPSKVLEINEYHYSQSEPKRMLHEYILNDGSYIDVENKDCYLELWEPRKGDYCWFHDGYESDYPQFGIFDYKSVGKQYRRVNEPNDRGHNMKLWNCIEPYIGQTPLSGYKGK